MVVLRGWCFVMSEAPLQGTLRLQNGNVSSHFVRYVLEKRHGSISFRSKSGRDILLLERCLTGVPQLQENAPLWDPTVGLYFGSQVGPGGWALSFERGTPVRNNWSLSVSLSA